MYKDKEINELKTIIETYKDNFMINMNKKPEASEMLTLIDEIIKQKLITDFKSRFDTLTLNNLLQVKDILLDKRPSLDQENLNLIDTAMHNAKKASDVKGKVKSKSNKPI